MFAITNKIQTEFWMQSWKWPAVSTLFSRQLPLHYVNEPQQDLKIARPKQLYLLVGENDWTWRIPMPTKIIWNWGFCWFMSNFIKRRLTQLSNDWRIQPLIYENLREMRKLFCSMPKSSTVNIFLLMLAFFKYCTMWDS